jgi:hypothetical protein
LYNSILILRFEKKKKLKKRRYAEKAAGFAVDWFLILTERCFPKLQDNWVMKQNFAAQKQNERISKLCLEYNSIRCRINDYEAKNIEKDTALLFEFGCERS